MASHRPKIRWTLKVRQEVIRELFASPTHATANEDALDRAGYALLSRCLSLRMSLAGQVRCPLCGRVFLCTGPDAAIDDVIHCPNSGCGWWTTGREYRESQTAQDCRLASPEPAIETFVEQFSLARTAEDRLTLIASLLRSPSAASTDNQPLAAALIDGTPEEISQLLSGLPTA